MKIQTRFIQITPYYMFCKQASDTMEVLRLEGTERQYLPMQFGGLFGQREILNQEEVMEVTDIDGGQRSNLQRARSVINGVD